MDACVIMGTMLLSQLKLVSLINGSGGNRIGFSWMQLLSSLDPLVTIVEFHMFITGDSEVLMFSPCVFVCLLFCLFVCVYVCHDVCPDNLTTKDWCHPNNILQVHCSRCLVVQVMFHALMTSLMTSQGDKVCQILNLTYLRQYLS